MPAQIQVRHNSLGLRDDEFTPDAKPTILFLGGSLVWGLDAEAGERFSELLKPRIADYRIPGGGRFRLRHGPGISVAAEIMAQAEAGGRGSDFSAPTMTQDDNSSNIRYEGYQKPVSYLTTAADGSLLLAGQPVPRHACRRSRKIGGCAISGCFG